MNKDYRPRTPEESGESIKLIVEAMNSFSIEELDEIRGTINRDIAVGPLLDPTRWNRGLFEASNSTLKVIHAIRDFKKEVSGIGNFDKIADHL